MPDTYIIKCFLVFSVASQKYERESVCSEKNCTSEHLNVYTVPAINITYQMISKRSNCAIFTEHTVLVFSVASNRDERESVSTKDRYYTSV